jgi:uncharacterized membrane-anchored protein
VFFNKTLLLAASLVLACATVHAQQKTPEQQLAELQWQQAPAVGKVGSQGEVKLVGDLVFLNESDTSKFLQLNGNPPATGHYTIANTKSNWFGVLHFVEEGYIKDNEKIDADALLKSLKEGNVESNEERKKLGLSTMTLEGWYFPPRYDAENKRLEWGTRLRSGDDNKIIVNVTTKVLGRRGYTSAILVSSPETMDKDLVEFKTALKQYDYVSGEKYSEWKDGDKVAAYGLGALVLGGAAAVATKKGGLKMIGIAILAAAAALWAGVKKLFGKKA